MSQKGEYPDRVRRRIDTARAQGKRAVAWVGVGSAIVMVFLLYGLTTALRLGHEEGLRAAYLGIAVVVGANLVSLALYRRQRKLLDQSAAELDALFGDEGDSNGS